MSRADAVLDVIDSELITEAAARAAANLGDPYQRSIEGGYTMPDGCVRDGCQRPVEGDNWFCGPSCRHADGTNRRRTRAYEGLLGVEPGHTGGVVRRCAVRGCRAALSRGAMHCRWHEPPPERSETDRQIARARYESAFERFRSRLGMDED